jgi:hypothetical protein
MDEMRLVIHELAAVGIDLEAVAQQLEAEGIALFSASYEGMLRALDAKRAALSARGTSPQAVEFAHWFVRGSI